VTKATVTKVSRIITAAVTRTHLHEPPFFRVSYVVCLSYVSHVSMRVVCERTLAIPFVRAIFFRNLIFTWYHAYVKNGQLRFDRNFQRGLQTTVTRIVSLSRL